MKVPTIISGGQTGADRAALDWAISYGVEHGGWCPAGRRAEDGALDAKYHLVETERAGYRARTLRNIRDSDATLVLNLGELDGGTLATVRSAERRGKPVRVVPLDTPPTAELLSDLRDWLREQRVARLNVAGPHESKRPGVYRAAIAFLERLRGAEANANTRS